MREFASNGARTLTFGHLWIRRAVTDRKFGTKILKLANEYGLAITDVHADFGLGTDLNTPNAESRRVMLANHRRALEILSEAGGKVATFHIGICEPGYSREELRKLTADSLYFLLPVAHRLGITIAIENTLSPGVASSKELLYYQNLFNDKQLGVCLDIGHVNCLRATSAKRLSPELGKWFKSQSFDKFQFEDNILEQLLPDIVTVHLHDNDGSDDLHQLPGTGIIDWQVIMNKLRYAPRLLTLQNETNACRWGHSIETLCNCNVWLTALYDNSSTKKNKVSTQKQKIDC